MQPFCKTVPKLKTGRLKFLFKKYRINVMKECLKYNTV